MKKIISIIIALLSLLAISESCNKDVMIPVEIIHLNKTELSMSPGDVYQLTADLTPENTTDTVLLWESSDPAVVNVNLRGCVSALSVGEAVVSVSAGSSSVKAECKIIVSDDITTPKIKVASDYNVGYDAQEVRITYCIENPIDGNKLSASSKAEWIEEITVSGTEIIISISDNDTESDRTAIVVLSYPMAENEEFSIIQKCREYHDLSASGTANCYIVSKPGKYGLKAVKGNSTESVGTISSAEVIWESFGTDEVPEVGELIEKVEISGDNVIFSTPETFKEGNALIAVKDNNGAILWSWHIWLTDIPEDQSYTNAAGIVMDRNLGATSAEKGDICSLGLMYQWGRKDPFMGSSSITESVFAKSTIIWPSVVVSDPVTGTIEYTISNPTTFIAYNSNNEDWYYAEDATNNDTLWQSEKTIYDPCPTGYKVPDGGPDGLWAKAFGTAGMFYGKYDSKNKGYDFGTEAGSRAITSSTSCWYPSTGFISSRQGTINFIGMDGYNWSCTPHNFHVYDFSYYDLGSISPANYTNGRASGQSVRCVKE